MPITHLFILEEHQQCVLDSMTKLDLGFRQIKCNLKTKEISYTWTCSQAEQVYKALEDHLAFLCQQIAEACGEYNLQEKTYDGKE